MTILESYKIDSGLWNNKHFSRVQQYLQECQIGRYWLPCKAQYGLDARDKPTILRIPWNNEDRSKRTDPLNEWPNHTNLTRKNGLHFRRMG